MWFDKDAKFMNDASQTDVAATLALRTVTPKTVALVTLSFLQLLAKSTSTQKPARKVLKLYKDFLILSITLSTL